MAYAATFRLRRGRLASVALCVAGSLCMGGGIASSQTTPATVHPEFWPTAHSPAAMTDPATEAKVRALMARMSRGGEGRTGDPGRHLLDPPVDLRTYTWVRFLAGATCWPWRRRRATPQAWLDR